MDNTNKQNADTNINESRRLIEKEYHENGKPLKCTEYNSDGSVKEWRTFEYDEDGNEIKYTAYNSDGSISQWHESEYDKNGNVVKKTYYEPDNSIIHSEELEYYENGKVKKYTQYFPDGKISDICEYDASGNEIKFKAYDTDGTIHDWVETEWDENGNAIKYTMYNEDGSIVVEKSAKKNIINCSLERATVREKNVFAKAVSELLSPIDDPRYILIGTKGFSKLATKNYVQSYACPSVIGANKETAAVLAKNLKSAGGKFELIFTRNEMGRKELFKCRKYSYINANGKMIKNKKIIK